jgi:predicted glycoside hydrolase/deacetylase ChbG (UPF0249 family)
VKLLVVNADDLGYDPEIDRGILEAHARGIVSSATAMVETPWAAAALAAAPPTLGVGLHAVLDPAADRASAERALRHQLARFQALAGRGPTHLDSHKHAHALPEVLAAVARVAGELGLPVRALDARMRATLRAGGVLTADHFLGDAALRPAWTEASLAAALGALEEGTTELMAHPGFAPRFARTSFGVEREEELAALESAAAREALRASGARLCHYGDLARALVRPGDGPEGGR